MHSRGLSSKYGLNSTLQQDKKNQMSALYSIIFLFDQSLNVSPPLTASRENYMWHVNKNNR